MLLKQQRNLKLLYLLGDLVALVGASILAMYTRFKFEFTTISLNWYVYAFCIILLFAVILIYFYGLYDFKYKSFSSQVPLLSQALINSLVVFLFFSFFVRNTSYSRLTFIYFGTYAFVFLIGIRYAVNRYIKILMKKGIGVQRLVSCGNIPGLIEVLEYLRNHAEFGYSIVGALTASDNKLPLENITILGNVREYEIYFEKYKPDAVLIGIADYELEKKIVEYCENNYVEALMIPDIIDLFSAPVGISEVASVPLIKFRESPLMGFQGKLKRLFDFSVALIALVLLIPLLTITSIFIKITSPKGPVIFSHDRLGRNGKIIKVYKFRTMVPNAQDVLQNLFAEKPEIKKEFEKEFKLKNDPRILPFGEFLRKTSIDELPQLINVIKGDMALVGPRPIVPKELEKYGEYAKFLLKVSPGITGLWQVSGRNNVSYKERTKLDMFYINNWSFWLDVTILLRTIPAVLARKGAY